MEILGKKKMIEYNHCILHRQFETKILKIKITVHKKCFSLSKRLALISKFNLFLAIVFFAGQGKPGIIHIKYMHIKWIFGSISHIIITMLQNTSKFTYCQGIVSHLKSFSVERGDFLCLSRWYHFFIPIHVILKDPMEKYSLSWMTISMLKHCYFVTM